MTPEEMFDNMEEINKLLWSIISDQNYGIKKMRELYQNSKNQIQQMQEQITNLEMIIRSKDDKIQELECLAHPESLNGDAICNWLS